MAIDLVRSIYGQGLGIQNYATLSDEIGSSVDEAIAQQREARDRAIEDERKARMDEMQQMQLAQLKANQYEALSVPGDTSIPSADQYLQQASRDLIDMQSNYVNQLKNGEIDTDEFARLSAQVKTQVPQLQATKQALTDFQANYSTLLQEDKLSESNSDLPGKLYNAITTGDMQITPNPETGEMMIVGADGELNMPLSQVGRLPKPTPKQPELSQLVQPTVAAQDYTTDTFNPESVRAQLDSMLAGGDLQSEKTLKAIAVDSLGMTLEEANALMNEELPEADNYGNTNRLEQKVEMAMINEARQQFEAQAYKAKEDQLDLKLKEARLRNLDRQLDSQGGNLTATQKNAFMQNNVAKNTAAGIQQQFSTFGVPTNEDEAENMARALQAYSPGGWEFSYVPVDEGSSWYNPTTWGDTRQWDEPGIMWAQNPKTKETIEIDLSQPDQIMQHIYRISGYNPVLDRSPLNNNEDSPLNKNSPLDARPPTKDEFNRKYHELGGDMDATKKY